MEIYERIFKEGEEIVEWVKERGVKLVSAMLFGSAVRGWREPEDLDVLIVVDEPHACIVFIVEHYQSLNACTILFSPTPS